MSNYWCFWTLVLEKTLESPLDCKEIKPVDPEGNQPWIFIGRIDAEAEAPTLWSFDLKSWLIGKDPDSGKDWRQEKKGTTENEMVGWHHQLNGHEFEQAPGVGDRQGNPMCYSPRGCKKSDTTEQLNWTERTKITSKKSEEKKFLIMSNVINPIKCYRDLNDLFPKSLSVAHLGTIKHVTSNKSYQH